MAETQNVKWYRWNDMPKENVTDEELAAEGASLILCARNAETLNRVSEQIAKKIGRSRFACRRRCFQ